MKIRKWKTLGSEPVYRTPIFDLHRRRAAHPRRGQRDFYVLEAPEWVNIIPLTRAREVVMVRQWRHGISGFTLEIPGGMVDPGDPSPAAAARREMLEETGYDSSRVIELGRIHPNPALEANLLHMYLARDVRFVETPRLDGGAEETQVELVRLRDIKRLIADGTISHALVIAAFSFFHLYNPPRAR
jgi:ADP-ribose diphosphatase